MTSFSVKNDFFNQIESIWNNPGFDSIQIKDRGYAIQDEIETNAILFIGINPSYNNVPGKIFYNNDHSEIHPYFKKFKDISQKVGLAWTHLDLLFLRETKQNEVRMIELDQFGKVFLEEQLKISMAIVEMAKPKLIVINNTYARELFRRYIETKFDEEIGTHRITSKNNLHGIPVFFTSMLTGQRALDLGSYERLIWQIKYVLRKNYSIV